MSKTRVLILYIKAGHGHYGIAHAAADALASYYPNEFDCRIEDVFLENDAFFQGMFQDFYSVMSNYLQPVYAFGYYLSSFPPFHDFLLWAIKWRTKKRLQRIAHELKPDVIVITHPILQRVAAELTVRGKPKPELFHFIVDIEPLPWYFKYRRYHLLVSTQHLKDYACRHMGYPARRVCVSPPPLRREFYERYDDRAIKAFKKKYGFDADREIFLIFGGGNGLPKGEKIVLLMLKHKLDADIAIVCGRNDFQRRMVELMAAHFGDARQKVHIFGFVEAVHELMAISDIVVSKAGFSSLFEILTLRKILIFSEFIWGQEKGNAMYLMRKGVGIYCKRPSKLARRAEALLANRGLQDQMLDNISRLRLTNGAQETAAFIRNIMLEKRTNEDHFDNV